MTFVTLCRMTMKEKVEMPDQYVSIKTMRKMLDISSKQAYRLVEERRTSKGIQPPTIPYKRIVCHGKPDQKEVLMSEIARYISNTLPTKAKDVTREVKRNNHQSQTLNDLKEILGNAFSTR